MAAPKTRPTEADVDEFLASWPTPQRAEEGRVVKALMERATGATAVMWGPTMVGFGSLPHTTTAGTNEWFVVGFSPRKGDFTLYGLHDQAAEPDALLADLGPHTLGASCVYIRRLDRVDLDVLERMVGGAWKRAMGEVDG